MYFKIKYHWELMCLCGGTSQKHAKTLQSDLTNTWPSSPLLGDQWDCTSIQKLFSSGKIKQSSNYSDYQGT